MRPIQQRRLPLEYRLLLQFQTNPISEHTFVQYIDYPGLKIELCTSCWTDTASLPPKEKTVKLRQ
jgi:hypothetical protein